MSKDNKGFSIIMSVYDQATELESNLPAFLTQEYEPGYDVVVVNETSTDNTEDVLKLMKQDYPHLYTTFLPKPNRQVTRRKLAFNIGAKAAKHEWLIITEIENAPTSNDLLQTISQALDKYAELTLGYMSNKGIRLQSFDTIDDAANHITKAERKLRNVKKRNNRMNYIWGRYDFVIIHKDHIVEFLRFFEQKISRTALFGIRMSILWQNQIGRSSTTLLATQ